ncbi:MAG: hypothetical protein M3154_03710 [Candidatus Eremiobacteraeota bacterium]|nr:hypothetical protein [Candidatus Eremiobacteraeota bacterium]
MAVSSSPNAARERAPDPLSARTAAGVRDRFLRDVLARVPAERVVEVHLFAPMRQGGVESGVAVLAARLDPDAPDGPETSDSAAAPNAGAGHDGRHTVYVARYCLTLKGAERGRWDVVVREEADAPLLAVNAAVRGAGRRANDTADATRLDHAAVQALLTPPALPDLLAETVTGAPATGR